MGTTLENVTITHCSRVAGYFRGDKLTIRHCLVSDTSTEGIYVIGSSDVLLEKNIFRRNNVEQITGYYPSAVKIFNQSYRVTCRDNLVIDNPDSNGIWYDVGNVDGVFVNNWVEDALDGFFFEISKGAICRRQRLRELRQGHPRPQQLERPRLPQHARQHAGLLRAQRAQRGRRPLRLASRHRSRRRQARRPRLRRQPAGGRRGVHEAAAARRAAEDAVRPAHERRSSTQLDGNVYVRRGGAAAQALIVWSPVAGEDCQVEVGLLEDLRRLRPEFEARGLDLREFAGAFFKSPELMRYELARSLPVSLAGLVPPEIRRLLGWKEQDAGVPGAYPARR